MVAVTGRFTQFQIQRAIWIAVVICLIFWFIGFNAYAPEIFQESWFKYDPMSFTGFLVTIVGLACSVAVDRDQVALLDRWHEMAIIDLTPEVREKVSDVLRRSNRTWQLSIAAVYTGAMVIGYAGFYAGYLEGMEQPLQFFAASFICALLIGLRMGRIASHGRLGNLIERHEIPFFLTISHPDRTGGVSQIGRFYLAQASILLFPIAWLVAWVLLIPSIDYPDYTGWQQHFVRLILICMFVFCVAFLLPMLSVRRMIVTWKDSYIRDRIVDVRAEMMAVRTRPLTKHEDRERYRELTSYHFDLTHLPNWPISPVTWSLFYTTILIPVVVNVATNFVKT